VETANDADVRDLEKFGYKQELRRALGVYSSFAVACGGGDGCRGGGASLT
jgi:hypothetical protein